jgi:vacuolar protein sorting-associated protein 13A/C
MDDEYQRDRMEKLNKKPSGGLVGGVLKGAGRLGAGLFEGAKGVITKPIQGAKDGGVPGFVVGVGKGVVGAVTRPVSGAVDCVGGTLTAIKT